MNIGKYINLFTEELELKKYSKSTINQYKGCLRIFLHSFDNVFTKPTEISQNKIKQYLRDQPSVSKMKQNIGCLKLFYKLVCKQPLKFKYIEYPKQQKYQVIILSRDELIRLFDVASNIKHKTIMMVAYATGVRVSELLNIKLSDIDRSNGVIYVRNGKGSKPRQVTMKPELLSIIEKYWRIYRTKEYLFEGQNGGKYSATSINKFLKKYAENCGIKKRVYIHLLRHQYSCDSLDSGENLYVTQKCLGHNSPTTTANYYYHISPQIVSKAYSPIQNIF